MSTNARPWDAIVCGAGIAGMAAALALGRAGARVLVLETRKKLGGRATSFTDPRTGEELDNCQHVTLGCCTSYLHLLAHLGMHHALTWHDQQFWIEPGGQRTTIKPSPLPAPAHHAPSLLHAKFLTLPQAATLSLGILAALGATRASWQGRLFSTFLDEASQPEILRKRFWDPVVISACNLTPDRVDASLALKVFQEGLLSSPRAARIGIPRLPLARLYDAFAPTLAQSHGQVLLGASVAQIDEHRVTLADGQTLHAGHIVCALPYERAATTINPALQARDNRLAPLANMPHSPILGVHLAFDAPVLDVPHAVLIEGATQWLFAKDPSGARIHAVISAADAWADLDEHATINRVLADVHTYFPHSRTIPLRWGRVVREKRATFAPTPTFERLRPSVQGHSRLLLAGDYCNTGWPATMEGAARAGYAAASAILGTDLTIPDLPPGPFVRPASAAW